MRKGMIINFDKWTLIEELTLEEQAMLLAALAAYHRGETIPELDRIVRMVFASICEDNARFDPERAAELSAVRKESGAKGGTISKRSKSEEDKQNKQNKQNAENNQSKQTKQSKQNQTKEDKDKEEDKEEEEDKDIKENPPTWGKRKGPSFSDLFADCPELAQGFVEEAWNDWIEVRKKFPWTDKAATLNANTLKRCAKGDPVRAAKILEAAVEHGWRGLYDLDDSKKPKGGKTLDWDSVVV